MNKRHKSAQHLDKDGIHLLSRNTWLVKSQQTEGTYTVKCLQNLTCSSTCKLKCSYCGVCPHLYLCTCLDNVLHGIPCKHIHLVHTTEQQKCDTISNVQLSSHQTQTETDEDDKACSETAAGASGQISSKEQGVMQPETSVSSSMHICDENSHDCVTVDPQHSSHDKGVVMQPETSVSSSVHICDEYSNSFHDYVTVDPQHSSHDNKSTACEALLSTCKELEVLIPKVSNTEAIKHANKSLRSVISLLKGTLQVDRVMPLMPTTSYAANSNHQNQLRFYSTKKKTGKHTSRWSKPTIPEELSVTNFLLFR